MGTRLTGGRDALAIVEPLESRWLMSAGGLGAMVARSAAGDGVVPVEVRARPNLNFVGNYLGTVNVKRLGTVSLNLSIDEFDPTQKFILGHISFIPIGRVPFDGTYKLNGPTFTYTTSKLANSLTLSGKLAKLGNTLTGKFTLVLQGTSYSGKYSIARQ